MIHSLGVILHHWSRSKKIGFHSQSCSRARSILIPSNTGRFLKHHHLHFPECSAISTHCSLHSLFSPFPHEPFPCPFVLSALSHLLIVIFLGFLYLFFTLCRYFIFSPSCMQSPFFLFAVLIPGCSFVTSPSFQRTAPFFTLLLFPFSLSIPAILFI